MLILIYIFVLLYSDIESQHQSAYVAIPYHLEMSELDLLLVSVVSTGKPI